MNNISHFILPENTNSLYQNEARSSISLTKEIARSINELIDAYNELNQTDLNWKQEQEGKIRGAVLYMKDNIVNTAHDLWEQLVNESVITNNVFNQVSGNKVDKNGIEQIKYANLSQEVKTMFTGGNTPIVGTNSVSTSNIVDLSVTAEKLARSLLSIGIDQGDEETPTNSIFSFDTTTRDATVLNNVGTFYLYSNRKPYAVNTSTLVIDTSAIKNLDSLTYFAVTYNPDTNVLHFHLLSEVQTAAYVNDLFLGVIYLNNYYRSKCILPFLLNNEKYIFNGKTRFRVPANVSFGFNGISGTHTYAKIDYVNKQLIIPPCNGIYSVTSKSYFVFSEGTANGLTLDIPYFSFVYLVVGQSGLKFITYSEFNSLDSQFDKDEYIYYGFINMTLKDAHLCFDVKEVKKLSILGDSISTYAGTLPEGNVTYYTGSNAGVNNENQIWWKRVMNGLGYVLNTNNSWSGGRVTSTNANIPSGITRCEALDNGDDPDEIIVFMGINDFNNGVALGTYNGEGEIPTSTTTFREAYGLMLYKIMKKYPNARLNVMTLPACQRNLDDNSDLPESNSNGDYLVDFNKAIKEIADAFNVNVIDAAKCGIHNWNASKYMGDYTSGTGAFLHPNLWGHYVIAQKAIKALINTYE